MKNDEKFMQSPMLEPDAPDKASRKHRCEEETLRALGYKWVTDAQAWVSGYKTNYALPLLRNFEARALADSINDFIKRDNK